MLRTTDSLHPRVQSIPKVTGVLPVPSNGRTGSFLLSVILCGVALLLLPSGKLRSQVAGEGTSFTVVIPYLSPSSTPSGEKIRLYFTSHLGSEVTVRYGVGGGVLNFSIPPGGSWQEALDTTDLMLPQVQGTFRRLLRVTADNPVTVAVLADRGTASEGYVAIPDELCGFEYVAVSETSISEGTFVTVAALENDTRVRLTPTALTRNGDPPGLPIDVTLDRGEVYQLISAPRVDLLDDDDLSGTRVVADRPVAVHSGATCLQLPIGSNISCGPLLEQLPHVDALGQKYVLPLFAEEERTLMRAVPVCAPTGLQADDFVGPLNAVVEGDSGTSFLTYAPGPVSATQRVLLAHLGTNVSRRPPTGLDGPVGDPTMSILVPENQMDTLFRFVVPALTGRVDGNIGFPWVHFVTVTRPDLTTGAMLNGTPLTFIGHVADTMVLPGVYVLESDGPVSVTPNGRSVSDAYAWVAGLVTKPFELIADTVRGVACFAGFDTVITVRNPGGEAIWINRIDYLNDIQGRHLAESTVIVRPKDSAQIGLRFEGSRDSVTGRIILFSGTGPCARRVGEIHVRLRGMSLQFDPPESSTLRVPDVQPQVGSSDTIITVTNTGSVPIDITGTTVVSDRFSVIDPIGPVRLLPGESRRFTVRFQPEPGDDLVNGSIRFHTEPCPDDTLWTIALQGKVRYFDVFSPSLHIDTTYCGVVEPDTIRVRVANYESLPLTIDSLLLSGGDPGEFNMPDRPDEPITIGSGDTLTFEIVYTPGPTGDRRATLRLFADLVDFRPYEVPIDVRAERYEFELIPTSLDFGPIDCGTSSERRVILRNRGTVLLRDFDVWLHRRTGFELVRSGSDPPVPGETLEFVIRPTGPPGEYRDTLHFVDRICGTDVLLPATVLCIDSGEIRIRIPEISGEIGELVGFPIEIEREDASYGLGIPFILEMTLRFRGDLLLPAGMVSGVPTGMQGSIVGTSFDGSDRLLELRFTGTLSDVPELGRIPGTILLGERASTPIGIDALTFRFDVSSDHFRTIVTSRDGSLEITGYCEIGGTRFVRSTGLFGMKALPNITAGELDILIDLVEDGAISIDLYDIGGRHVEKLFAGEPGSGRWSISTDLAGLPTGPYIVRLQTLAQTIERRVVLRR